MREHFSQTINQFTVTDVTDNTTTQFFFSAWIICKLQDTSLVKSGDVFMKQ